MKFKLFGTDIYVSFLFSAVIVAMLATDRTGYILPLLLAVFLHEMGHLVAMWCLDAAPKRIRLIPTAVEITAKFNYNRKNEIKIALAGPMVNLFLATVLIFNYAAFKNEDYLVFGIINLLIGAFNLLPVTGLDGGNILFALLVKKLNLNTAGLIMKIINLSLTFVILAFALYLLFRGEFNPSPFIIGLYLLIMNLIKI